MKSQTKKPTTPKQTQILFLLYRFRFLNRIQIQTMLKHKDPRRIKSWLADLTIKGILNRTYSKTYGQNTKPAVYFLATNSHKILKKEENVSLTLLKHIYQEKTRSQNFRERSMFIADIYLRLETLAKEAKSKLHFYTQTDLELHTYFPKPLPAAYIAIEEAKDTKRYFLEIISEQIPRVAIRKRIENLIEYYSFNEWQEYTKHEFPAILIICPNNVIKGFLSKSISQTLDSDGSDISFYLTTIDKIRTHGVKPDIWQKITPDVL